VYRYLRTLASRKRVRGGGEIKVRWRTGRKSRPHRTHYRGEAALATPLLSPRQGSVCAVHPPLPTSSLQLWSYRRRCEIRSSSRRRTSLPSSRQLQPLVVTLGQQGTKSQLGSFCTLGLMWRGLRRKGTLVSQPYRLPYTFPPTTASTVARSSRFQIASPIHALVSPR